MFEIRLVGGFSSGHKTKAQWRIWFKPPGVMCGMNSVLVEVTGVPTMGDGRRRVDAYDIIGESDRPRPGPAGRYM